MISLQDIPFSDAKYEALLKIIKQRTGMDLKGYREGVARRRIARRLRATHCENIDNYLDYIRSHGDEAAALVNLITIQVSQFFRNPEVFDVLREKAFPDIFANKAPGERVIVWSAGCADGEEAYSIAILLLEYFSECLVDHRVKVVGTDVNRGSLASALLGRYDRSRVELVGDSIKKKYFCSMGNRWEVRPRARGMVEFREENLFIGRGVDKSDMILARNMLIYFDRERQELLLDNLMSRLNPGGYLVLGKSETLPPQMRELVKTVASRERVYQRLMK